MPSLFPCGGSQRCVHLAGIDCAQDRLIAAESVAGLPGVTGPVLPHQHIFALRHDLRDRLCWLPCNQSERYLPLWLKSLHAAFSLLHKPAQNGWCGWAGADLLLQWRVAEVFFCWGMSALIDGRLVRAVA